MHLLVEIKMFYSEMQCVENFKVNKCIFWSCWSSKTKHIGACRNIGYNYPKDRESHHNPDKLNSILPGCLTSKEMIVKSAKLIKKMHILQET